jgi:uncharacterized Ntn-hydrolase superfamily protein
VTYSIVARDPETGELGVAVQSHWFGVGSVVPHVRPGVGAVATQSVPDPTHGARILDLLAQGTAPDAAIDAVLDGDEGGGFRQLGVIDARGRAASYTGPGCMAEAGDKAGTDFAVQANIMETAEVWPAMAETFAGNTGPLAERMLAALDAAEAAGGDIRGQQSAALVVLPPPAAPGTPPVLPIDLRVEDHPTPLDELRRLLVLHRAYAAATAGDEAMAEGRLDDMVRHYEEGARLAPNNPELVFWAGMAASYTGDRERGLGLVEQAIAASPGLRTLLQRLTADVAPGAETVRRDLESRYNS